MRIETHGIIEKVLLIKEGTSKKNNTYKKVDFLLRLYDDDKTLLMLTSFDNPFSNRMIATDFEDKVLKEKMEVFCIINIKAKKSYRGTYFNVFNVMEIYQSEKGGPNNEEKTIKESSDGDVDIPEENAPF